MVPILIETDEKCSRRLDAGIVRSYETPRFTTGRCGPEPNNWEREMWRRDLSG
jgi:hypothetical protein